MRLRSALAVLFALVLVVGVAPEASGEEERRSPFAGKW